MVSCCVITKNEERHLDRCLSSVKGIASEIIVVDSGSTDATISIAERHDATIIKIDWIDDFAYARNIAIQKAREPWILFLDADESLKEGQTLLKKVSKVKADVGGVVLSRYDHFINPETGKQTTVPVGIVRLFRNDPNISFEYHVHEVVGPSIQRAGSKFAYLDKPIIFHHIDLHTKAFLIRKQTYYLSLLDQGLEVQPNDAWLTYQKAKTLWFFEQNKEALHLFQSITVQGTEQEIRIAAYNNAGVLLGQAGEYALAEEMLNKSLELQSHQSQTHYLLGDLHERFGQPGKAIRHYNKVRTKLHLIGGKSYVPGGLFLFRYQKYYRLALCYKSRRLGPLANYYLDRSLKINPNYVDAIFLKAKWSIRSGKEESAKHLLDQILELNPEWEAPKALRSSSF
ncbi:MAG: glycosyltransferase [Cytophagales bacterium]|nr:glycosyltransferase [Cytophagales bacterium]